MTKHTLPMTIDELMEAGGVEGLARAAALDAANETRREWLGVLEAVAKDSEPDDDIATVGYVTREIATLRRRLGITTPSDTVREQSREQIRERMRRYLERRAGRDRAG